jgi:hypothetical protein
MQGFMSILLRLAVHGVYKSPVAGFLCWSSCVLSRGSVLRQGSVVAFPFYPRRLGLHYSLGALIVSFFLSQFQCMCRFL